MIPIHDSNTPLDISQLSTEELQEQLAIQVIVVGDLVKDISKEAHAKQYYLERCQAYSKYLRDLGVSLESALGALPKKHQSIFTLILTHLNKEISAHDLIE